MTEDYKMGKKRGGVQGADVEIDYRREIPKHEGTIEQAEWLAKARQLNPEKIARIYQEKIAKMVGAGKCEVNEEGVLNFAAGVGEEERRAIENQLEGLLKEMRNAIIEWEEARRELEPVLTQELAVDEVVEEERKAKEDQ